MSDNLFICPHDGLTFFGGDVKSFAESRYPSES